MEKMLNPVVTLASVIEHTLLRPDTSQDEITQLCKEAIKYKFYAVCVPQYFVKHAKKTLGKSKVKVVTVVGFPMGYSSINGKAEDCKKAINDKVDEIDMVMNIAALKSGNEAQVRDDIQSITTLCRINNILVKVIIETGLLTDEEIIKACNICTVAEVDFVKTSTGFNGPGASVEKVKMIREILPASIGIKASGGINDAETAMQMMEAGASRIGTSSGVKLIER
ncbi:MAG: deoxyribose-phosphate aldolase [Bacteroidia bacterium]